MNDAAKHLDPQMGVDIHMYAIPPGPLPTPHIGQVMDPFDYIPGVSTVTLNGVHRGIAGTAGTVVHIPLGVFAPGEGAGSGPQPDGEVIFMGSQSVIADGEPFARIGMQVLDCQFSGMGNPARQKPAPPQKSGSLPTGTNQAIPSHVKVGGPPVVKGSGGGKEEQKKNPVETFLQGLPEQLQEMATGAFDTWRRFLIGTLPGFLLEAAALRADPVDIRDGSMVIESEDFRLPGRLPLVWRRHYASRDAGMQGQSGYGWRTPADICLHLLAARCAKLEGPERVAFFVERPDSPATDSPCLDFVDGARLSRTLTGWKVGFKDGLQMGFDDAPEGERAGTAGKLPISRIEDAHGNAWYFERNNGVLLRIVESGVAGQQGRHLQVDTHQHGIEALILHDPVTGNEQRLAEFCYDSAGNLIAALDAAGAARTYQYERHRIVQYTDRVGMSFHYRYDEEGRVVRNWGDGGLLDYHFAYDAVLRETRIVNSLGAERIVKLNESRLPLCEIDPLDGVTFFEYDSFGRTTAVTDPVGLRTCFEYDDRRNLTGIVRADGAALRQQRDAEDRLLVLQQFDGTCWNFAYDERGNLVSITDPCGATTTYSYDAQGQVIDQVDARQAQTRLRYDRHGLLAALIDPLGHEIRYQHDARGNLLATIDALGRITQHGYDACGRVVSSVAADGAIQRYRYDGEGQLLQYTDPAGAITALHYVGIGRVGRRVQPDGNSVEYVYDTEEQLIGVINPRDESYQLRRDCLGRIVEEVDYWGQSRHYRYDAGGRLTSMINALGQSTEFQTDALGRITRRRYHHPLVPGVPVEDTFRYDPLGRMVAMQSPDRHVSRTYNARGQLLEEWQDEFVVRYAYDIAGNRIQRTSSTGNRIEYRHDLRGQLAGIATNALSVLDFEHGPGLHRMGARIGAGVNQRFDYDVAGRMTSQALLRDDTPGCTIRYAHASGGELLSCEDTETGVTRFEYDPLGRLLQQTDPGAQMQRYLNDAAGDRLATQVRRGDGAGWLREGRLAGTPYEFDALGCLLRRGDDDAADALRLKWDGCQRLAYSDRGGVRTTYGYDAIGRRAFKRTPGHTTWFYWDGDELLAELCVAGNEEVACEAQLPKPPAWPALPGAAKQPLQDPASILQRAREYVMHPQTAEPLLLIEAVGAAAAGCTAYFQNHPNGAPLRLLDAGGNTMWQATSQGWGAAVVDGQSIMDNPLRLLGQYFDVETGLHYNRHRYYDPGLGSFISQDPSGLASGVSNLYEYAVNVHAFVDPMGLCPQRRSGGPATGMPGTEPDISGNPRFGTRPQALNDLLAAPMTAGAGAGGGDARSAAAPPSFNDIFFGNRGRVQFGYGIGRRLFFMGFGIISGFPSSASGLPGFAFGQANGLAAGFLGMGMGALLFGLGQLFAALCREE